MSATLKLRFKENVHQLDSQACPQHSRTNAKHICVIMRSCIQAGEKVDYPDKAKEVCEKVASGEYEMGILICGTGIGMSMSANKIKGIRAACCSDYFSAQ